MTKAKTKGYKRNAKEFNGLFQDKFEDGTGSIAVATHINYGNYQNNYSSTETIRIQDGDTTKFNFTLKVPLDEMKECINWLKGFEEYKLTRKPWLGSNGSYQYYHTAVYIDPETCTLETDDLKVNLVGWYRRKLTDKELQALALYEVRDAEEKKIKRQAAAKRAAATKKAQRIAEARAKIDETATDVATAIAILKANGLKVVSIKEEK